MEKIKYSLYIHINKSDNNKAYVEISKNPKRCPTMSDLGML